MPRVGRVDSKFRFPSPDAKIGERPHMSSRLACLFRVALDRADYAVMVARCWIVDLINGPEPSTTEHSRSTFNCGRTVTLPKRPEVAEPRNRNLEAVNQRRTETPSKTAQCRGCCSENTGNGGGT